MAGLLLILAAASYLVAAALYGAILIGRRSPAPMPLITAGRIAGVIGVALHTAAIGEYCIQTHHSPITTPSDTLSATGWTLAMLYLAIEVFFWRKPPIALGAFAFPLSFLSVFSGSALRLAHPSGPPIAHLLDDNLVSLHVIAILFSFGLLALAVCCALLYLIEHRLLKTKRVTGIFANLPPLNAVDQLAFTLVSFAFPLLTIGIVSGVMRALSMQKPMHLWGGDPHTLASFVSWAFYGGYLWARGSSWRGVRANYLLLAGLAAAILTYFAPSTLHQFT